MAEQIKFREFHKGQDAICSQLSRFTLIRAGRRFGKTAMLEDIGSYRAIQGLKVGWFAPSYKLIIPTYKQILRTVRPLVETASKIDGLITTQNDGLIEFWSLDNEDAGRSRSYDLVIIDEASLKARGLRGIWEQAIKPTLLDRGGSAIMAGTPKGIDEENYFYVASTNKQEGWKEFHAPTWDNPFLDAESVSKLKEENAPLVWQQEYAAEFVDWSGSAFFDLEKMLVNGLPIELPEYVDSVFAVADTAVKTGQENDGTGLIYCAIVKYPVKLLIFLDYEYIQIEGSLLESWLPSVYQRLEEFQVQLKARFGSLGIFIEDKSSGMILLQQAQRRGWAAHALDSVLTSVGKDERAISVSSYFYKGMVKISQQFFNRVVNFKGITKNHAIAQICGYRVGQKDKSDDLLDCATYSAAIALGDADGF